MISRTAAFASRAAAEDRFMATRAEYLAEAADGLALAVIASSQLPVLLLDGELRVVAASETFVDAFQSGPVGQGGVSLAEFGEGEWASPELALLLAASRPPSPPMDAYELYNVRAGRPDRSLLINARKLDYFDGDNVRLLMSVTDVTEAHLREELQERLLRDKEMLLQELQHRVANSLQIIASVLMLSARRVRSWRARGQIRDAGNRVLSIAALQRQLSVSKLDVVALRPYLTELCASIGASMIGPDDRIALSAGADETVVTAEDSVRLGLIVTELVINALKHGFPGRMRGRIDVDYRSLGDAWSLTVRDTGIGLAGDRAALKPGLGTSIVGSLALQMRASVEISAAEPGTRVAIIHR
jgi:two-component system, sensor histidine kinase PdtaS